MSGVGMRAYELAASAGDNHPGLGTRKPCPEGFLLPSVTWRHYANTSSPMQITCNPGFPLRGHLCCWPPSTCAHPRCWLLTDWTRPVFTEGCSLFDQELHTSSGLGKPTNFSYQWAEFCKVWTANLGRGLLSMDTPPQLQGIILNFLISYNPLFIKLE